MIRKRVHERGCFFTMCRIEEDAYDDASLGEVQLLGASGHLTAAAQQAMREVEEVHQRDALMQYEACAPHPDLTQVSTLFSTSSNDMCLCMRWRWLDMMTWAQLVNECSPPITRFWKHTMCMHVQVQQSILLAALRELGLPLIDSLFLARTAAEDLARDALLQPFRDSRF